MGYALIGVAALLLGGPALIYNRLVKLRNRCDNAWAQIAVQLKRRYELVPNIVQTVKGYAAHEKEAFERVTRARTIAAEAATVERKGQAETALTSTLRSVIALSEAYPDLKADESFGLLMDQLIDTEGKIAYARQFFNDSVMSYNTAIQQFPASAMAPVLGFAERRYFEVETVASAPVDVHF